MEKLYKNCLVCLGVCVGVVYLYVEYTYPSWTGPIALPALDSSAINARVIDSVAPRPPSCYKYMLKIEKQNVLEVDIENSIEHKAGHEISCKFSPIQQFWSLIYSSAFFSYSKSFTKKV